MTSFRKIVPALLCAVAVAGAALPASAEPFHGGFGHGGGWRAGGFDHHHGWGVGRTLAVGGLGLATGALIANAYEGPAYAYGGACGQTVTTHYNAYGELVKVVRQTPC
ncbi:hypothetical protein [Methylopila sp. M107]|uniref:hypothetical protein n=1 Tax=Methylopila sp. M107 TaxID=1101190 RepID=UPI00058F1768|nr:hypothetical protein [Methylopila sp. M107]